ERIRLSAHPYALLVRCYLYLGTGHANAGRPCVFGGRWRRRVCAGLRHGMVASNSHRSVLPRIWRILFERAESGYCACLRILALVVRARLHGLENLVQIAEDVDTDVAVLGLHGMDWCVSWLNI